MSKSSLVKARLSSPHCGSPSRRTRSQPIWIRAGKSRPFPRSCPHPFISHLPRPGGAEVRTRHFQIHRTVPTSSRDKTRAHLLSDRLYCPVGGTERLNLPDWCGLVWTGQRRSTRVFAAPFVCACEVFVSSCVVYRAVLVCECELTSFLTIEVCACVYNRSEWDF